MNVILFVIIQSTYKIIPYITGVFKVKNHISKMLISFYKTRWFCPISMSRRWKKLSKKFLSIIERKGSVCPWSPLKLSSRINDFVTTVASVLSCQLLINSLRRCSKIFIHFLLSWLEEKMLRSRNMLEFLWERFRKLRLVATRIFIACYFLQECLTLIFTPGFRNPKCMPLVALSLQNCCEKNSTIDWKQEYNSH